MAHKSRAKLLADLNNLKSRIKVGDKIFHYKHPDQYYRIVTIGFIESTEEPSVVYKAEYGDKITWIRTESDFFSKVNLEDGTVVDRFSKVG